MEKENFQETRDVKGIKVCLCEGKYVELFTTLPYKFNDLVYIHDSGIIYLGLNSDKIGLKVIQQKLLPLNTYVGPNHAVELNNTTYNVNCKIEDEMDFEDARLNLYKQGELDGYYVGKATDMEALKVLNYAMKHYGVKTAVYNGVKVNDISNTLVCSYDEDSIGLFKTHPITISVAKNAPVVGYLYVEVNSRETGMKSLNGRGDSYFEEAGSTIETNHSEYHIDHQINNEINFEEIRLQMFNEGLLKSYVPGLATEEEIAQVVSYARDYFKLDSKRSF